VLRTVEGQSRYGIDTVHMLFMLRISIEVMLFALFNWELWLGLVLLVLTATIARRRVDRHVPPRSGMHYTGVLSALSRIVVPLVILAWACISGPNKVSVRTS
jgi:hypothetical protein